ncbi:MAG: thioredoxin [Gelidibacter sp.]
MKSNFKTLIDSKIPVLIDFYAEWCGPCKTLTPVLIQVKSELKDDIKIVKIDVDKNPSLAASYKIKGVPTMMLFKNGIQVWRQSGVLQTKDLIKVITAS